MRTALADYLVLCNGASVESSWVKQVFVTMAQFNLIDPLVEQRDADAIRSFSRRFARVKGSSRHNPEPEALRLELLEL